MSLKNFLTEAEAGEEVGKVIKELYEEHSTSLHVEILVPLDTKLTVFGGPLYLKGTVQKVGTIDFTVDYHGVEINDETGSGLYAELTATSYKRKIRFAEVKFDLTWKKKYGNGDKHSRQYVNLVANG